MEYNPFSLKEKTIVVTGASSGIGRQCAIDISKMGAKVIMIARNEQRLSDTLSELEGEGHHYYSYDLSEYVGIKSLFDSITTDVGKMDGLVCCAGIEKTMPARMHQVSDYEDVFKVNTLSTFEVVKCATDVKNFNIGGVILISSITSVIARQGTVAYSASKGALVSGCRVWASELSKRGIRVNCISPGTILTPLMQNYLSKLSEENYKKRIGGFPLGLGEPSDISNACIFLLSDAGRWITGQNLIVDGGYTML